jgi:hypothetical protein
VFFAFFVIFVVEELFKLPGEFESAFCSPPLPGSRKTRQLNALPQPKNLIFAIRTFHAKSVL